MGIRTTIRNIWRWMTTQRIEPQCVPTKGVSTKDVQQLKYYAAGEEYQEHEDKIILDAKTTDSEIAKQLGRSRAAIQQRRYRLNKQ